MVLFNFVGGVMNQGCKVERGGRKRSSLFCHLVVRINQFYFVRAVRCSGALPAAFVDKFEETLDSRFLKVLCENVFYLTPEIALKKASKRRTWTTAEVRELRSLARKKTPAKKIARTLKRSEGATRQKAGSIGLSLDSRM